jgi:hypothetical protein
VLKLYYKVWADVIIAAKKKKNNNDWKMLIIYLAVFQALNYLTVLLGIMAITKIEFSFAIEFDIFPGKMLDSFLSGFIFMMLPFILINYFLILYKDKYKVIIKKYNDMGGKLCLTYMIVSFVVFIVPVIIGKVFY